MATIGKLVVTLTAKTAKFRSGLAKAANVAKKFGAGIAKAGLKVAALGAAAVAAAATGLAVLINRSLDAIDTLGKLAARLGDSTAAIAGLRFAAELTGAGAQTLDKSLEQLTRRLGEAKTGTGEALGTLDALGLSAVDLANKMPSDAFVEVAEAINQLGTAADKAQAAYDLFGRSGVSLLNTLAEGKQGLADMAKEAEGFGITMTNVQAKMVENANDATTRMKALFGGFITQLTIQLAPVIEDLANRFTEWGSSGAGAAEKVAKAVVGTARSLDTLIGAFDAVNIFFKRILQGLLRISQVITSLFKSIATLANVLTAGQSDVLGDMRKGFADDAKIITDWIAEIDNDIKLISERPAIGTDVLDYFNEVQEAAEAAAESAASANEAAGRAPPRNLNQEIADIFAKIEAERDKQPAGEEQGQVQALNQLVTIFTDVREVLRNPEPVVLQLGN